MKSLIVVIVHVIGFVCVALYCCFSLIVRSKKSWLEWYNLKHILYRGNSVSSSLHVLYTSSVLDRLNNARGFIFICNLDTGV